MVSRKRLRLKFYLLLALLAGVLFPLHASAETQDLAGVVVDEHETPIPGAVCTLKSPMLPQKGL